MAAATLIDKAMAWALCEAPFGVDFHPAEAGSLVTAWSEFLPEGVAYWLWEDTGPAAAPE